VSSFPDSQEYLATSHHSLFSADFWAGLRGPAIPLLYKLLPTNHMREAGQLALSILAWLGLALAVSRSVRQPWAKLAGAALVLLFSLTPWIVEWEPLLLSESLSLTLTAALIAIWLELIRQPSRVKVAVLIAVAFLWATARDPNGYILLLALVVPAVWFVRSRNRRLPAAVLVGLLVVAVASLASSAAGERWKVPLVNVIGHRILTDADATAFFQRRGMPQLTPQVTSAMRVPGFIDHQRLKQLPGWPTFDDWLDRAGRQTYTRYLASHPIDAITRTVDERAYLFGVSPPTTPSTFPLTGYRATGTTDVLPGWLSDLVFPPTGGQLWLYFVLLTAGFIVMLRRGAWQPSWMVPCVLIALAVPHAFIVVLGDTSELTRHAMVLGVTIRLAFLLTAIFILDAAVTQRGSARGRLDPRD
jgi:hypothetical protein